VNRIPAVAAALAAALTLAACGGDDDGALSKDDYKKEAQSISDKFETDARGAIENATSKDPAESLTGVQQLGGSSDEAADKLDKLEPPEDFKDVHGRLLGALRTLGDRADGLEQAVDQKDQAGARQALTSFQQSLQEVDKIGTEFDRKVGTT
jgi:hypothetical protein